MNIDSKAKTMWKTRSTTADAKAPSLTPETLTRNKPHGFVKENLPEKQKTIQEKSNLKKKPSPSTASNLLTQSERKSLQKAQEKTTKLCEERWGKVRTTS
jgi:dipeptidase